uniref:Uncharacterized protein n=1 Tax=Brassica oleracea var. oleracea TaxID=109376 RepID=A0A0D3A8N5_BRAOL
MNEVKPDGTIRNPWRLCSVQQVEDFKAVIRIIPCALATIFWSTPIATQLSLIVLQGLVMDISLGPKFKIPAGYLQVVTLLSTCSFIIVNDRLLYPFYQKLTGKFPTPLQRVGIGHVLNILSMALSAIVEAKRLKIVENGHFRESSSVADMSALWLFPSLVIVEIGNVALCYQEFPESMKNTATSITSVVIGICFYTSTALIDLIQRTTDWLPDDINHGRVDNVYWICHWRSLESRLFPLDHHRLKHIQLSGCSDAYGFLGPAEEAHQDGLAPTVGQLAKLRQNYGRSQRQFFIRRGARSSRGDTGSRGDTYAYTSNSTSSSCIYGNYPGTPRPTRSGAEGGS